jgi:stage II sporulation protein D
MANAAVDEDRTIRVLLTKGASEANIETIYNNQFTVKDKAYKKLKIKLFKGQILASDSIFTKDIKQEQLEIRNPQNASLKLFLKQQPYNKTFITKGSFRLSENKNKLRIVNYLNLHDYLLAVVPHEMPLSWSDEAIKAQIVAARTYTLKNIKVNKTLDYDLKTTVADQRFGNINHASSRLVSLLAATKNQVLLDKYGNLIDAYYSSSSSTSTASPEEVWGVNPAHYLYARPNHRENSQYDKWQRSFTYLELKSRLKDVIDEGKLVGVTILNRSADKRIKNILLTIKTNTTNQAQFSNNVNSTSSLSENFNQLSLTRNVYLTGEEFRHKFSLPSTMFDIRFDERGLVVDGGGFGHGIGMSQYGAKSLAKKGWTYTQILEFYYPGASIETLD